MNNETGNGMLDVQPNCENLLKNARRMYEEKNWEKADYYYTKLLELEADNGEALSRAVICQYLNLVQAKTSYHSLDEAANGILRSINGAFEINNFNNSTGTQNEKYVRIAQSYKVAATELFQYYRMLSINDSGYSQICKSIISAIGLIYKEVGDVLIEIDENLFF